MFINCSASTMMQCFHSWLIFHLFLHHNKLCQEKIRLLSELMYVIGIISGAREIKPPQQDSAVSVSFSELTRQFSYAVHWSPSIHCHFAAKRRNETYSISSSPFEFLLSLQIGQISPLYSIYLVCCVYKR